MSDDFAAAPHDTRLGRLQRGHGAGFRAALADPSAARDDVLACIARDPRIDRQCERRVRYYTDLVVALDVPVQAVAAHVRDYDPNFGSGLAAEVFSACWRRGHGPARSLLANTADDRLARAVGIAMQGLWGVEWDGAAQLPPAVAAASAAHDEEWGSGRGEAKAPPEPDGTWALAELFQAVDENEWGVGRAAFAELCRRRSEKDREALARHALTERWPSARLAARALGSMGDLRLVDRFEEQFTAPTVLRPGLEWPFAACPVQRFRRMLLLLYFLELPAAVTLPFARRWRGFDDHRGHAAMRVLGAHAEASDRAWLEAEVDRLFDDDGSSGTSALLRALAHIGDPASAPLFLRVVDRARYSVARAAAIAGLARMPDAPGAAAALRDALWDAEDSAAESAAGAIRTLDAEMRGRLAAVSADPLAAESLRSAAGQRLARG